MCNYSSMIYQDGKAEGIRQGKAEGIRQGKAEGIRQGKAEGKTEGIFETTLKALLKMVKRFGLSLEDAMNEMEIPSQSRQQYRDAVIRMA